MTRSRWFALLLFLLVSTAVNGESEEDHDSDEDDAHHDHHTHHSHDTGFPPHGCKSTTTVCSFSVTKDGQKYKVESCLIKNSHLSKPKGTDKMDAANAAVKSMKSVGKDGDKKILSSDDDFEVEQKKTFTRGGEKFVDVEVKHVEEKKGSVAKVNVQQKMIGVSPRKLQLCIQKGLYASIKETKGVWIYQNREYSYMKFH